MAKVLLNHGHFLVDFVLGVVELNAIRTKNGGRDIVTAVYAS